MAAAGKDKETSVKPVKATKDSKKTDSKNAQEQSQEQEFMIQKVFVSDVSLESPKTPNVFKKNWKPDANIELHTTSELLSDEGEGMYLVNLILTVTVKNEGETAFLVEVKQSGIFSINGMGTEQLGHVIGAYCPTILFPYAKETIASLVAKAGFPEVSLAPVNFDALYMQSLQQNVNSAAETMQ